MEIAVSGKGKHWIREDKDKNGNPWIEYLSFGGGQFVELFYGSDWAGAAIDYGTRGFDAEGEFSEVYCGAVFTIWSI